MKRRGFTLIELLVVVAIISILASILFPVFARAREKARQTSCLSNAKQLGLGVLMYAQDYDEIFPSGGDAYGNNGWVRGISPYIKNSQLFVCPSRSVAADTTGSAEVLPGLWSNQMGYGWNFGSISGTNYAFDGLLMANDTGVAIGNVSDASSTIMLGDMELAAGGTMMYIAYYTDNPGLTLTSRHNGGGNYCFADGHGKWLSKENVINNQRLFKAVAP